MASVAWPSPLVVVVATYDGRVSDAPWLVNTSAVTYVVYQRHNPSAANYVPNIGMEAGVFLRFIHDNYDALPERTAFLQEHPEMHNRAWYEWMRCLRPTSDYAPLVYVRIMSRDFRSVKDGLHAVAEQCWRNFLSAFGLEHMAKPGARPTHAYYGGALFVASRSQLRRRPREAYGRADALTAGGDGRCHVGALNWTSLYAKREDHAHTVPLDDPQLTKHTQAAAMERLHHTLVGGMGLRAPYRFDWCKHFASSHVCYGSPCHPPKANRTGSVWDARSREGRKPPEARKPHGKRGGQSLTASTVAASPAASVEDAWSASPLDALPTGQRERHHARWYLLPYRGPHKRFARRQEIVLEGAWRRQQITPFKLNVSLRQWHSRTPGSDDAFNVSLPHMSMLLARPRRPNENMHIIRRLPAVAPGWWHHGHVACGFELDRTCMQYNRLNAGREWNRTLRQSAARSGTVQKSHNMDTIRDIW